MENLRVRAENDLAESLEGDFRIECELTNPDGETQIYKKGSTTEKLAGQFLNFSQSENPATGEEVIVQQPVMTLRVSSLNRIPVAGENWYIKVYDAVAGDTKKYVATATRSPENGSDIGFIRLYLQKVKEGFLS
jgi:hypothetical protein